MFEFLKKKLKKSIDDIKTAITVKKEEIIETPPIEPIKPEEEQVAEEVIKEVLEKEAEENIIISDTGIESEFVEEALTKEEIKAAEEVTKEIIEEAKPKKEGIFKKLSKAIGGKKPEFAEKISRAILEKKLSEPEFENIFKELEISLLEANIAFEVIQLIKENLKKHFVNQHVKRGKVEETILKTIESTFREILSEKNPKEIEQRIDENKQLRKPTSFLFLGVNGVGKTTSLAKMVKWLQNSNYSCVIAASDTFRAASIEQLEKHAEKLGVKVIKHQYGADPAAVAFDAIEYAKAHGIDCVLIDSAGRQHSNTNLMDELRKLRRVAKPDFTIFVADSLTGNDAVEQAREFSERIGYDFSILAKADVDHKGGAILSVSYISQKPIAFLGVGQAYEDFEPFDKEKLLAKLIK